MVEYKRQIQKEYWQIALPAALEGLLIVLLSSVDMMMISSLGTHAVAAISIFSQPKMVMLCLSRSLAVAVTILVAHHFGQNEKEKITAVIRQSTTLMLVVATFLLGFSLVFIEPILILAGAKSQYLSLAIQYGYLVSFSLFFQGIAIVINGGLTGIGQTTPMLLANVVGNIVNVILNAYFIYHLRWGVGGAALATVIGSFITLVLTLIFAHKRLGLLTFKTFGEWRLEKNDLSQLSKIVGGVLAEQGFERIGMFLYARLTAELGVVAFATHNICMTLCDVYYNVGQGMSKASLAIAGRYKQDKSPNRLKAFIQIVQRQGLILSIIVAGVYFIVREPLITLYTKEIEVIQLGKALLIFVAICCIPQTQSLIVSGVLRGLGQTTYVAKYSLWSIAVIRPIITAILCFGLGLGVYGAWCALLLDQTMRMGFALFKIKKMFKK